MFGLKKDKIAGKEKLIAYYEGLLERHGDSHLSLDWNSKDSQLLRYSVLLELFGYSKTRDFSLLDVGCGVGHFYDFLNEHKLINELKIAYKGIDISEKLIGFAKNKHKNVDFQVVDLLDKMPEEKYDFVIGSGIFSVKMADIDEHKKCAFKMFTRMFALTKNAMAVNFISSEASFYGAHGPENDRYVYFSPEEIISLSRTLTHKYVLKHDYHPADFTVFLFK